MSKFTKAIEEVKAVQEADERAEKEVEMDEWFRSLNSMQTSYIIMRFWDDASHEEKEHIFKKYKYK